MKNFKAIAEEVENDDMEEYDLVEFYEELMEDFKEDLDDLKNIIKQLGLKNEVAAPVNEIATMIDSLDDIIREAIEADEVNKSEEDADRW